MDVLIAEDSTIYRRMLETNVKNWGYHVTAVEDGDQAWSILKEEDSPPLCILDWHMPGMNGIEVCRQVKALDKQTYPYVIMLTSRDSAEDMVEGLDAGADDYLTKPVNPNVLSSRLKAACRIINSLTHGSVPPPDIPGYRIVSLLGKGACATVWKAVQQSTGNLIALKLARAKSVSDSIYHRFSREIYLMKQLNHPNIAKVYDADVNDQSGYCAMEYVDGSTLEKYIRTEQLPVRQILSIIAKVCDALEHAHQHGVVHRDLKPTNILINPQGEPILVDFGLGKSLFRNFEPPDDPSRSIEGMVIGTPLFMAPEQAQGHVELVDGRSDIYSVGMLLYVFLVRRHPYEHVRSSIRQTLEAVAEGAIQPPHEQIENFDPELEKLIMKALAYDPDERYQSAQEMAQAIRCYLQATKDSADHSPHLAVAR